MNKLIYECKKIRLDAHKENSRENINLQQENAKRAQFNG